MGIDDIELDLIWMRVNNRLPPIHMQPKIVHQDAAARRFVCHKFKFLFGFLIFFLNCY